MFTHTYRPRKISEIYGQLHIKRAISNLLKTFSTRGEFPRSIILCGPYGTGKTTLARIIARYANCDKGPLTACGECESCQLFEKEESPDFWEVDAVSYNSVEDVPIFKEWISFTVRGRKKFLVLDEAHRLSGTAWDALLKVIEEGDENVCFVMCTTETHKIPATIVSRSQQLKLFKLGAQELADLGRRVADKEGITIESENALMNLVRKSDGHARDLVKFLESALMYGDNPKVISEEAVNIMMDIQMTDVADACLRAALSENREEVIKQVEQQYYRSQDFCHSMVELLRQEIYLRSVLAKNLRFGDYKTKNILTLLSMLEDTCYRMGLGETLTAFYIGYERWKLGHYVEVGNV